MSVSVKNHLWSKDKNHAVEQTTPNLQTRNQTINKIKTNGDWLDKINESIEILNSSKTWTGNAPWLGDTLKQIHMQHAQLRFDIIENKNIWNYSQNCKRLAYFYYNLACYYNVELFDTHRIGLSIIKTYLEMCVTKIATIPLHDYCTDISELENDAICFLDAVWKIYEEIVVGDLQLESENFSDTEKQHIQNVQLLTVIDMLENAVTMMQSSECENPCTMALYSDYLRQAYQLAGHVDLSQKYREAGQQLVESLSKDVEIIDVKQQINDIIAMQIKDHSDLSHVRECIEDNFHKSCNNVDNAYVARKYLEHCIEFWQEETKIFFNDPKNQSPNIIEPIFMALGDVENLRTIPEPFRQFDGYKLLMDHCHLIDEINEKKLVHQFKAMCSERMIAGDDFRGELVFLAAFIAFLNYSNNLALVICRLDLNQFCLRPVLEDLFTKIVNFKMDKHDEHLRRLQAAVAALQPKKSDFLIGNLMDILQFYVEPVKVQVKHLDGRLVLEVVGTNMTIGEIYDEIHGRLSTDSAVEEVRFVCHTLNIDKNLTNELWHGKNIVVIAEIVRVVDKQCWDVSGENNSHMFTSDAGTDEDGNGQLGNDGYPGESGGNVLILTQHVEQPELLTIVSQGGCGSAGQDGGKGKNGASGTGITRTEFDENFPLVCNHSMGIPIYVKKKSTLAYMILNSKAQHIKWLNGYECENIYQVSSNINEFTKNNIFIKMETKQGYEVTFSVYENWLNLNAFLLHKGSRGQVGGNGGAHGLGGQGGYGGDITVTNPNHVDHQFNVAKISAAGTDGQSGAGGLYGQCGKNGTDMGYVDSRSMWNELKYENGNFKVEYYNDSAEDRVWCEYYRKYAAIRSVSGEANKIAGYEERNNTKKDNQDRQRHANAVRKKNISQTGILANYSHHLHVGSAVLDNLQTRVDNFKQLALKAIVENQKQMEKSTLELKTTRHLSYETHRNYSTATIPMYATCNNINNFPQQFDQISDQLCHLHSVELTLSQLNQLYAIIGAINDENITKLFIAKYRLATFREIAQQLSLYCTVANCTRGGATIQNVEKYLIEMTSNDMQVSHFRLGRLDQYWQATNRDALENIIDFYQNRSERNANDMEVTWQRGIKEFVREVDETCEASRDIAENQKSDWYACCVDDQAVVREYVSYIRTNGPLAYSFRELLAYTFDVNIRFYVEDQIHKELVLLSDHNPWEFKKVYILYRNNKFIQMNVDENYVELRELRKTDHTLYTKILSETKSFTRKDQFDKYLESATFLFNENFQSFDYNDDEDREEYEKEIISTIASYFSLDEKKSLVKWLDLIYKYQPGVLDNIAQRFTSDGRHVSCDELCHLISACLTSLTEHGAEETIYDWIIAAHVQHTWIDETLLLQLENYFRKTLREKTTWRQYMAHIENKNVLLAIGAQLDGRKSEGITVEHIGTTLYLLSQIPNDAIVNLAELNVSEWHYALKGQFWTSEATKLALRSPSELAIVSYHLTSMENTFGTRSVQQLLGIIQRKRQSISSDLLVHILSAFHNETVDLSREELEILDNSKTDDWLEQISRKISRKNDRTIDQLVRLIESNANTCDSFKKKLRPQIADAVERICGGQYDHVANWSADDINKWAGAVRNAQPLQRVEEMLAVIDRAIELTRGFKLRDTQRLTVLALAPSNGNTLAQVATGEGKSLIVMAVAIMQALCGGKVDIVTSSSVLAKRDAVLHADIYTLFNINVSHNCSENIETRTRAYSENQIIYGDLSNFQRDYLLDRFYGKNILGNLAFQCVIVDEVDSMLLDKGNNMLYLSHDLPDLDKLQSVYIYIWQAINMQAQNQNAFDTATIRNAVLGDLFPMITVADIGSLDTNLTARQSIDIWNRLVTAKIINADDKLCEENNANVDLTVLEPEWVRYTDRVKYLLAKVVGRNREIHVPNYLRPFIELHLDSWIRSAIIAFDMRADEDYVVDVDKTESRGDINPNITIIDRDTGTDQANSQWDQALHQFLQLKHGCKISLQTLKAVFISNVSYFKLYGHLYGLTGTLGSQQERDLLQKIHTVDFVTIPTAKCQLFREEPPIMCASKDQWIEDVVIETTRKIDEEKRSVLIICATINDVQTLYQAFGRRGMKNVHKYFRDYEQFDVADGSTELVPGRIIIATNLAGRGTDIKISAELRDAGGLHVLLTYLPNNVRVEQQAFGRAARCGDRGSGQLVVTAHVVESNGHEKTVFGLKRKRDNDELHRVCAIKDFYERQITVEEDAFKAFKVEYMRLKQILGDKKIPDAVQEILLKCCLDKWCFWLDKNGEYIKENREIFDESLDEFLTEIKNLISIDFTRNASWINAVDKSYVQMIKLGKYLSENKNVDDAIELFNEVIKEEPIFSGVAHYYKAFALAKKINWERVAENKAMIKQMKVELRKAAKLFETHGRFAVQAAAVIGTIKNCNQERLLQIDAFETQHESIANLYLMFAESIGDILGRPITPDTFVDWKISRLLAAEIFDILCRNDVLKCSHVTNHVAVDEIETICRDFGTSAAGLGDFLSGYRGQRIDNTKQFRKCLKDHVRLVDKSSFWKVLIEQNVLSDEVKYIIVDYRKMEEFDSLEAKSLQDITTNGKRRNLTLKSTEVDIFFSEHINESYNYIYEKKYFVRTVGSAKYQRLKQMGLLSDQRTAKIHANKIDSVIFPCYDSIRVEDFVQVNIVRAEAEQILAALVKQQVVAETIVSGVTVYRLKAQFDQIYKIQLSDFPVYEDAVIGLLLSCFAYRIALQKIAQQIEKDAAPPLFVQLPTHPHRNLLWRLLDDAIIKPVKLTMTSSSQLDGKLKNVWPFNSDEMILKNTIRSLLRSTSVLKTIDVPNGELKSATEFCTPGNMFEMHTFTLNGLNHLIQWTEQKWTTAMLCRTAIVTAIGLGQIVTAACMQAFFAGFMTHVAAGLVREGVGDLVLAVCAMNSGHLTWSDYKMHKIVSLAISGGTLGVGAWVSGGVKVSTIGSKIAAPGVEYSGIEVSKTCGMELINIIGAKDVGKQVFRQVLVQTTRGITMGVANVVADDLVQKHFEGLGEKIALVILSDIKATIVEHNMSAMLRRVYVSFGVDKGIQMINDISESILRGESTLQKFMSLAGRVCTSVTGGITSGLKKSKKDMHFVLQALTMAQVWVERAGHLMQVQQMIGQFLNDVRHAIGQELESRPSATSANVDPESFESFQSAIVAGWQLMCRENSGRIITTHIVTPLMQHGCNQVLRYAGKKIKEQYKSYKDRCYRQRFDQLKKEHTEEHQVTDENNDRYHEQLLKLMATTRNPKLLADIVRENVPMDLTCVHACARVLLEILRHNGIALAGGLTVTIHGDDGLRQTFTSDTCTDSKETIHLTLELKNKHFQISDDGSSASGSPNNNCLYDAIVQQLPQLKDTATADQFRNTLADTIENDKSIRHYIGMGWHKLHLRRGEFGGYKKRKKSADICTDSSTTTVVEECTIPNHTHVGATRVPNFRRIRDMVDHFQDRCTRTIEAAGMLQRISDLTGMARWEIIKGGASEYQDRASGMGAQGIHAAHVVRGCDINPIIVEQYPEIFTELRNFFGHTQNIRKEGNVPHGPGGKIDMIQENFLNNPEHELHKIDYSRKAFSNDEHRILNTYRDDFSVVTQDAKIQEKLQSITVERLHQKGHDGYSGKNTQKYIPAESRSQNKSKDNKVHKN